MDDQEQKEQSKEPKLNLEIFKSNLNSTADLIYEGILPSNTQFGLGELCEARSMDMPFDQVNEEDPWAIASKKEKENFLRNVIIELELVPEQLTRERAIHTFRDEGLRGESSEGGADVMVFKTKYPIDLHVKSYGDNTVGNRYDLVVTE